MKTDFNQLADSVIELVGGESNIIGLTHCITRLRFTLKDENVAKTEEIEKVNGVMKVIQAAGQYQVVIGNDVVNAYDAILKKYDIKTEEVSDVSEEKPKGLKGVWDSFLAYVTGTMVQTLPALIIAGLTSVILTMATTLFNVDTANPTYQLINVVKDAGFYFMPIFVGFAASKKLNCNPFIGAMMGAILVHPNYNALVQAGTTELFGFSFMAITYSSTVIPMLLIIYVESFIEKFYNKVLPGAIKAMFAPLFTIFTILPIALFALGPVGYVIGSGIVNFLLWVYSISPLIVVPLIGVCWPLLVMVGSHTLLVPTMVELVTTVGYDAVVKPGAYVSNFAILGVVCAIALKYKKQRENAIPAATSAIFGVSEPALYGIILPMKKTLLSMIVGSAAGGVVSALLHVKSYAPAANSILSIMQFGDTMIWQIIAIVVGFSVAFAMTWMMKLDIE